MTKELKPCECVKVYKSDCMDIFGKLPMVDAIITDPPYNISRKNNFNTMGRQGIDFGEWDEKFDLVGWIGSAVSILKPGGSIIIFNA